MTGWVQAKKVIVNGIRKCHHAVRRHEVKEGPRHSGPGRQSGCEKNPGKNTCPSKLYFSLSGDRLHTSNRYKLSLTKQNKSNYPLEIKLNYVHNHSIISADAKRYRPIKMQQLESGEIVVAICDKFCRRVHENVPQAGDIVLMDATSNLDRHDTKLFHLVCPTPAGGLPLGNILTSKGDAETINAGIKLLISILPEGAFFGRGPTTGPKIVMTDDCAAEQKASAKHWADTILLLCIFHLLQAYWRYLWNSDHKIEKCDRPDLFNMFKMVVYASNEADYCDKKTHLLENSKIQKYPKLRNHLITDILPRKQKWALTTRIENKLSTHNVNTTNFVEISFRITKENQFNRIKSYNLADLLDIILDDSIYYVQRCINIGNNCVSECRNQKSRYFAKHTNIAVEKIIKVDNDVTYLVPSETVEGKFYNVNMELGLCECAKGMLRGPCKHKHIVAEHFNILSCDVIPKSESRVRAFYHFLTPGTEKDANWYRSLSHQEGVADTCTSSRNIFGFMQPDKSGQNIEVLEFTTTMVI